MELEQIKAGVKALEAQILADVKTFESITGLKISNLLLYREGDELKTIAALVAL